MRSQTLILFILTLGLAWCVSLPIDFVGHWKFKSSTPTDECLPSEITITSLGAHIMFKWKWEDTLACQKRSLENKKVIKEAIPVPNSNKLVVFDPKLTGESFSFTLNGNSGIAEYFENTQSIFEKKTSSPSVEWAGNWFIKTRGSSDKCYPRNVITIYTTSSTILVSWTWDLTEACSEQGIAGSFYETTVAMTSSKTIDLFILIGNQEDPGTLSINGKTAIFTGHEKQSCELERTPLAPIDWYGTWELKKISSGASCLPDGRIGFQTDFEGTYTYYWDWESNDICTQAGLSKKRVYEDLSALPGDSVTLQDGEVSLNVYGEILTFVSQSGGSGIFLRQYGGPLSANWVGKWAFKSATQSDGNIPKEIFTSILGSQILFEWKSDSWNRKIRVPKGTSITVPFESDSIPFKFILSGSTAIIEGEKGSKFNFEKEIISSSVNWAGTWIVESREPKRECYPRDKITVSASKFALALSWVWDLTEACGSYGLAGVAHKITVPLTDGNMVDLPLMIRGKFEQVSFRVNGNSAIFKGKNGHSCSFIRDGPQRVNWGGTWILKSTSPSSLCSPTQAIITKLMPSVTVSWIWDSTESCKQVGLAEKPFSKTLPPPSSNSLTLNYPMGSDEVVGTFSIEGDSATLVTNKGDSYAFDRQFNPPPVEWAGTWKLKTASSANACYPKDKITVELRNPYPTEQVLTFLWIWDTNEICDKMELAGKYYERTLLFSYDNSFLLSYGFEDDVEKLAFLSGNGDIAQFSLQSGDSCTFVRHGHDIDWTGTWIIQIGPAETACSPKKHIVVSPSEDSLTYSWVWGQNEECKKLELSGKPFMKTIPIPKENSVILDFIGESPEVTNIFTINADTATLSTRNGNSYILEKQTEKPLDWSGTWFVKRVSSEACCPKKKMTISNIDSVSTYNWVWDSNESCDKLELSGKTFNEITPVPNGDLTPLYILDRKSEVYVMLTVEGNKAIFNNLDGSSCVFDRINDDDKKEDDDGEKKKDEKKDENKSNGFIIWLIIFFVAAAGVVFCVCRKRKEDQIIKTSTIDSPSRSFLKSSTVL